MSGSEIGLREFIREVVANMPDTDDLMDIAKEVAEVTPGDQLMRFYTLALRDIVGDVIRDDRCKNMDRALQGKGSARLSGRSPKLEERRDWWAAMLSSRVHIGGSENKQLGDCTIDELQFCVNERASHIIGLQNQMNNFKQLIQMMVKHGVRTVSDLPPQKEWKAAA